MISQTTFLKLYFNVLTQCVNLTSCQLSRMCLCGNHDNIHAERTGSEQMRQKTESSRLCTDETEQDRED